LLNSDLAVRVWTVNAAVLTVKLGIFLSEEHKLDSVKHVKATLQLVENINARIAICSSRFVVSHSEVLLERWVKRTHLDKRPAYISVDIG
jgi:hypothetical protein